MIIVFASRKGGSGKSTVCCNVAAELSQRGHEVLLIDTDPQYTSGNWCETRTENPKLPMVTIISAKPGKQLSLNMIKSRSKYDFVLVDLQGIDSDDNRFTMPAADKVVVPFKPSQPDLDTLPWLKKMADDLQPLMPHVEWYYFINEAPTSSSREKNEARAFFEALHVPLMPTVIHSRMAYRESMSQGLGVTEMGDEKAKAEILTLIETILGSQATDNVALPSHVVGRASDSVAQEL